MNLLECFHKELGGSKETLARRLPADRYRVFPCIKDESAKYDADERLRIGVDGVIGIAGAFESSPVEFGFRLH